MGTTFSTEDRSLKLNETIRKLEADNRELNKQITSLKNLSKINNSTTNKVLSKQTCPKCNTCNTSITQPTKVVDVSNEKINKYVEKILTNEETNCSYLPDFVERKIYTNIITIGLNLLDDLLETTSIKFVGHEIKFDLVQSTSTPTEKS